MKKILCFGDSNTYGFIPQNRKRYPENIRWSGILKSKLSPDYQVIEAGCNNRTGFFDNPAGKEFTGYKILPEYLKKYNPDIVITAIGINDLQFQYNASIEDIKNGLDKLLNLINDKEIILLSPSVIKNNILNSFFAQMFDETSIQKSSNMAEIYQKTAEKYNAKYINLNEIVTPSDIDGLHYEPQAHSKIADKIIKVLKTL